MQKHLSVLAIAAALAIGTAGLAQAENSAAAKSTRENAAAENTSHEVPDTLGGSRSRVPDTLGDNKSQMPDTLGGNSARPRDTRPNGNGYGSSARENEGAAAQIPETLGGTDNGHNGQNRR